MGDFGIFNGKNDLAKFLSIGGVFLIVFSILYPVEKKKELDLLIVKNNNQIRVLNDLLNSVIQKQNSLIKRTKEINSILDNPKSKKSICTSLKKERKSIEKEGDLIIEKITNKTTEIYNIKDRIKVNKTYSSEYGAYLTTLTRVGWGMLIVGLIGWLMSARKEWNKP